MFKLRYGYLVSGILIGFVLLYNFIVTFPDKKLHIVFCNVGQGDAAYIKFPDGRDMLVDGGPDEKVLTCLSGHMPFWDRTIDMVLLSHPEKDHGGGLVGVLARYNVTYFLTTEAQSTDEFYKTLMETIKTKHIGVRTVANGDRISVGSATLSFLSQSAAASGNLASAVFLLSYGAFDALFPGDAPIQEAVAPVEVLKVPHHGSKTDMNVAAIDTIQPKLAVISVGKNSFGHPAAEVLGAYTQIGSEVRRTDQEGDIEVVSDGNSWTTR